MEEILKGNVKSEGCQRFVTFKFDSVTEGRARLATILAEEIAEEMVMNCVSLKDSVHICMPDTLTEKDCMIISELIDFLGNVFGTSVSIRDERIILYSVQKSKFEMAMDLLKYIAKSADSHFVLDDDGFGLSVLDAVFEETVEISKIEEQKVKFILETTRFFSKELPGMVGSENVPENIILALPKNLSSEYMKIITEIVTFMSSDLREDSIEICDSKIVFNVKK